MPTEPDYRLLFENAQQCADSVRQFLVAVANSPQGKENTTILGMAALTIEQVHAIENQVSALWDEFQRCAPATQEQVPFDPTASMAEKSDPET